MARDREPTRNKIIKYKLSERSITSLSSRRRHRRDRGLGTVLETFFATSPGTSQTVDPGGMERYVLRSLND